MIACLKQKTLRQHHQRATIIKLSYFVIFFALLGYASLVASSYLYGGAAFVRAYFLFGVGSFAALLIVFKVRLKRNEAIAIALVLFLLGLFILKTIVTGDDVYLGAFKLLLGLFIAIALYRAALYYPGHTLAFTYLLVISLYLYVSYSFFILDIAPNSIFERGSRNHITTLILTTFMLWALCYIRQLTNPSTAGKISFVPAYTLPLFTAFLLMVATGRSGLLVALLILSWGVLLHFSVYPPRQFRNIAVTFFLFVFTSVLLAFLFATPALQYTATERYLEQGFGSAARFWVWSFFFENAFTLQGLLGLPYYLGSDNLGLTWHSSFIELWVHYGLIGTLCFLLFLLYAFLRSLRRSLLYGFLLAPLLIRAAVDGSLFGPALSVAFFFWALIVTEPEHSASSRPGDLDKS